MFRPPAAAEPLSRSNFTDSFLFGAKKIERTGGTDISEFLQVFAEDVDSLVEGHPDLAELLQHWKALCGDRKMPERGDFDPAKVPRLLADICLVEVIDGGSDYFYRVAGSRLEELSGQKLQGRRFSEITHAEARESMRATCAASVHSARPVVIKNKLREPGRDHVSIIAIILPMSDDGETVNMILTLTEFEGIS